MKTIIIQPTSTTFAELSPWYMRPIQINNTTYPNIAFYIQTMKQQMSEQKWHKRRNEIMKSAMHEFQAPHFQELLQTTGHANLVVSANGKHTPGSDDELYSQLLMRMRPKRSTKKKRPFSLDMQFGHIFQIDQIVQAIRNHQQHVALSSPNPVRETPNEIINALAYVFDNHLQMTNPFSASKHREHLFTHIPALQDHALICFHSCMKYFYEAFLNTERMFSLPIERLNNLLLAFFTWLELPQLSKNDQWHTLADIQRIIRSTHQKTPKWFKGRALPLLLKTISSFTHFEYVEFKTADAIFHNKHHAQDIEKYLAPFRLIQEKHDTILKRKWKKKAFQLQELIVTLTDPNRAAKWIDLKITVEDTKKTSDDHNDGLHESHPNWNTRETWIKILTYEEQRWNSARFLSLFDQQLTMETLRQYLIKRNAIKRIEKFIRNITDDLALPPFDQTTYQKMIEQEMITFQTFHDDQIDKRTNDWFEVCAERPLHWLHSKNWWEITEFNRG